MSSPPLTVLIPTHGRPTLLKRMLDSIAECELPESYEELVVIENGSRAGAEELVTALPERLNTRYMHRGRGNKSYALNEALETIEDGLVVFFDDDVRVEPQVLVAYAGTAAEYGREHFFGGPVEVDCDVSPHPLLESFYPQSVRGYEVGPERQSGFYLGFNWAAFSEDIKNLGGFDPRFGPGSRLNATGQESDMQARMRSQGLTSVDVEEARVHHYFPRGNVKVGWLLQRYVRGGVRKGVLSPLLPSNFAVTILSQTFQSLGVLAKGVVTLDPHKMLFVLLNTAQRIGVVKGYLQRRKMSEID